MGGGGGGEICVVHALCFCMCMYVCAYFVGIILDVLDSWSGTAWGKRRLENEKKEEEKKEKIPIVGEGYPGGTTYLEVSPQGKIQYTSPITPNSAFHIGNRMLSKLGAKV